MKNTYQELKLTNGEVIKMTLNFARLLKLKNERKDVYARLMHVLQGQEFDPLLDSILVLYVGYLCASDSEVLSEDEFVELVPFDMELVNTLATNLITSKKK